MTAYLWTHLIAGVLAVLCRAIIVSAGKPTTTTPATHVWSMVSGFGFLCWTAWLLFVGNAR